MYAANVSGHMDFMVLDPKSGKLCWVALKDGEPDVSYEMKEDGSCEVTMKLIPIKESDFNEPKLVTE